MVESAYFLQGHPAMDLVDVYCELILNALHLAITVRGGAVDNQKGLTVRSCRTLLN